MTKQLESQTPATCQEALYKYDPEERATVENEARHMVTKQLRKAVMELCELAFDQYLQKKGLEPLSAEGRRINMKRVTYWNDEYGCWSYHCSSGDAAKLLAAYEDTGLEPEEVLTAKENAEVACALNLLKEYQSVGSVEHFRELSQAERDGRLVVLPCKVGDKIFHLFYGEIQNLLVSNVIYRGHGGYSTNFLVECIPFHRFYWREEIGKTVFLTREEAEAALKNSKRREI